MSSTNPDRPSDRSAARTAKPRARRDDSGIQSKPSRSRIRGHDVIRRPERHRRVVRRGVTHEGEPRVVGHVEPLVGVGRPRIRLAVPAHVRPERGHAGRPDAEGAIDMDPCLALVGDPRRSPRADRRRRCSRCRPGRTRSSGRRSPARTSRRASGRIRPWSSAAIRRTRSPSRPMPEHLERRVDRDVGPAVGHDGDRRRALQAEAFDIPADPRQHRRGAPRRAR